MQKTMLDTYLHPFPRSFWREELLPHYPTLDSNTETEVGVIGGGIVGILTAYRLAKQGKIVTLIEADRLLEGVTGHTSAKVSIQHGYLYSDLIQSIGIQKAKLYVEANRDGLNYISELVEELSIDCDWQEKESTIYSTTSQGKKKIHKELWAYEQLQLSATYSEGLLHDLPLPVKNALTLSRQAQFHPVKFLKRILEEFVNLGGTIYENTRATQVYKDPTVVHTNTGHTLICDKVVVASHYPFNDFNGSYFSKLSISRSYSVAAKLAGPVPQRMYLSVDLPKRSMRPLSISPDEQWLLIGGETHPTGKSKQSTQEHYRALVAFGLNNFRLVEAPFHWSSQDMTTLDLVPYIGQMTKHSRNIFVATGMNKWGMTNGALASQLITDLICEEENPYTTVFTPLRTPFKQKSIQNFFKKNLSIPKDFFPDLTEKRELTLSDLKVDEGKKVTHQGKILGAYKDPEHQIHLIHPHCTHMGCSLNWNNAERSWDCPCHGSRFSYTGEVLNGPATNPLKNE
ncbi:FAD-dependent oxidoreductase [Lacticigenium naphthae]|uniref:FAD-dependent oxidoreductase n=1 Tax=Lacticigenium naphthae TaxID=515351 RepID=UPI0004139333|nr:FAD-dependent oxidoreductase [Lacticigenium naphthae]